MNTKTVNDTDLNEVDLDDTDTIIDEPKIDWEARAKIAEAEAEKQRKIKRELAKERDELRAKTKKETAVEEDYKKLYQESSEKAAKVLEKAKRADIRSTASVKLTQMGIQASAIEAAIKLLDQDLVEWDEDHGVDDTSISAAVSKLKSQFGFLFEKTVPGQKARQVSEGKTNTAANEKVISQDDWKSMNSRDQREKIKMGYRVQV